jgi:outer membrane protein
MGAARVARRLLGSAAAASLALVAAPGARAEGGALTLARAVLQALESGAAARIARLETDRAGHAHGQARSDYLPQVGLTSEAGWSNRIDDTFFGTDKNGNPQEYSLATIAPDRAWLQLYMSQTLFDLRSWREIERREIEAQAAQIAESRGRDDVSFEVTQRYMQLLRLQQETREVEERLVEAQWLAQQSDALYEAGRVLELDRSLAKLHLAEAELETRDRHNEMAAARDELWLALGEHEPRHVMIALDPDSLPSLEPRTEESLAERVVDSPEMRILELQTRIQDAVVAAAKAGRWPTLKLVSGYSNYGPQRFDAYEDEVWVGVDLQVPIFDGFKSGHAIEGAQRDAEIARLRYQRELDSKRARVRDLVNGLETGAARLTLAEQRAATAREQLRLADLNLRAQRGGLAEAVAAREQLRRASSDAADAYYGQIERWAMLQRELGRLTDELLGPQLARAH